MSSTSASKPSAGRITTVGLDGDDTLWHSENHFAMTTERLVELLDPWIDDDAAAHDHLITVERRNLASLGYGVKAFTLSMIETAIEVSHSEVSSAAIQQILRWGQELLDHPVELLDGVADTLQELAGDYRLVVVTKGDLLHQESKVARSGLTELLDAVEIVSEKDVATYSRVLERNAIGLDEFLMVGNSVRSDILPVLELGARALHVPYDITWALEHPDTDEHSDHLTLPSIRELPAALRDS